VSSKQVRTGRNLRRLGAVFEVKKGIPVEAKKEIPGQELAHA
jgi:hypothetical protein